VLSTSRLSLASPGRHRWSAVARPGSARIRAG